ncbi:MAG: hypothetical protein AUJ85_02980 [Elusimicrobia bacterium CG1_02_37_114]|nr:MAG: hypothetical protein AUJ85_02980 [Elusimicrobia bacterium CG1_02_37_114]PIV52703.1 MAG: hypothetical protein COS17_07765 [Elusimicrobia bacterium CG02_land_8_20_14_3_00_37_13]PIZ13036.1 MAG: hypothetical protein COY53_06965 [Elusimicrobia bacterium CG_4_10_14_0_8_um_filter_37_32]
MKQLGYFVTENDKLYFRKSVEKKKPDIPKSAINPLGVVKSLFELLLAIIAIVCSLVFLPLSVVLLLGLLVRAENINNNPTLFYPKHMR